MKLASLLALIVAVALLALPVSLGAAAPAVTKTKTLSGAVTGGGEKGSISFKVVIRNGVVKKVKRIVVTVPYECERLEGGVEFTQASVTIPGPFKVTHVNGHPNFSTPKVTVDGRTWRVGANMPNDMAKKAIGAVTATSTSAGGGTCMNSGKAFVAT